MTARLLGGDAQDLADSRHHLEDVVRPRPAAVAHDPEFADVPSRELCSTGVSEGRQHGGLGDCPGLVDPRVALEAVPAPGDQPTLQAPRGAGDFVPPLGGWRGARHVRRDSRRDDFLTGEVSRLALPGGRSVVTTPAEGAGWGRGDLRGVHLE